MANDMIKKASNGTYYFRANLGFDQTTGKRIQKYRSGFKTKKEAKEAYAQFYCSPRLTKSRRARAASASASSSRRPIFLGTRHR